MRNPAAGATSRMRILPSLLVALAAAVLLAGCAAYSDAELTRLSQAGVRHSTLVRMEHGHPLAPEDIIDLTRHGVPSSLIARHLDRHGSDALLTRNDVIQMRKAGVRPPVIDAAVEASEEFAREHGRGPEVSVGWGVGFGYPDYYYY